MRGCGARSPHVSCDCSVTSDDTSLALKHSNNCYSNNYYKERGTIIIMVIMIIIIIIIVNSLTQNEAVEHSNQLSLK